MISDASMRVGLGEFAAFQFRLGISVPLANPGYKSYIEKAKEMKATFFNTPKSGSFSVWEALEEAGIDPWEVNRQFLDDAIARGDIFYVEADLRKIYRTIKRVGSLNEVREKGYLYREIYYLIREKGYRIQGSYLIK